MKHIVFILIICVLFSGCGASLRQIGCGPDCRNSEQGKVKSSPYARNIDFSGNNNENNDNRNKFFQQRDAADNRFVLVTDDITYKLNLLRSSVDDLNEMNKLKFSISGRFNLVLPSMNNGPKIGVGDAFVDRSQDKKIFYFDITDIGKLHVIVPNACYGKDVFRIAFEKDGELLILGFKRSCNSNSHILSTVEYGTEFYLVKNRKDLPHLTIYMNQNIFTTVKGIPFSTL